MDLFSTIKSELTAAAGYVEDKVPAAESMVTGASGAPAAAASDLKELRSKGLQLQSLARQISRSKPWQDALGGAPDVASWLAQAKSATSSDQVQALLSQANDLLQKSSNAWSQIAAGPSAHDYVSAAGSTLSDAESLVKSAGSAIAKTAAATPNMLKYAAILAVAGFGVYLLHEVSR